MGARFKCSYTLLLFQLSLFATREHVKCLRKRLNLTTRLFPSPQTSFSTENYKIAVSELSGKATRNQSAITKRAALRRCICETRAWKARHSFVNHHVMIRFYIAACISGRVCPAHQRRIEDSNN